MRADRLLRLLMLLQGRGRKTGLELCRELEVSVRTVYRDLRALEAAGVPLVAEGGPGGGIELMEGFRTDLTGLTGPEAEALFAAALDGPLAALGMEGPLKTAFAKLAAGSPARLQAREEKARKRILLDAEEAPERPSGEGPPRAGEGSPRDNLAVLREAVMASRRVRLVQRVESGPARGERYERSMEPYGLVWRGGAWYIVGSADGRVRAIEAGSVVSAEPLSDGDYGGRFDIPDGFDLAAFWKEERERVASLNGSYSVRLKLRTGAELLLAEPYASRAAVLTTVSGEDCAIELAFSSAEEARSRLAPLGEAAEILFPAELRTALADLGAALVRAHGAARRPLALAPSPPEAL